MAPSASSVLYCAYNDGQHSGQLRVATYDGTAWQAETVSNDVAVSDSPNLVGFDDALYCFMQTPKNGGWLSGKRYEPKDDVWQDLTIENAGTSWSPGAVVYTHDAGSGPLFVFHPGRGSNSHQLHYVTSSDGTGFSADSDSYPGVSLNSPPAPVVFLDQLHIMYGHDGQLLDVQFGTGKPAQPIGVELQEGPSAVVYDKSLYVFYQSPSGKDLLYSVFDGTTWKKDLTIAGVSMSASPSACVYNDNLYVLHRHGTDDILMFTYLEEGTWQPDTQVLIGKVPEHSQRSPSAVTFAPTA
jgi:hypothetical protein